MWSPGVEEHIVSKPLVIVESPAKARTIAGFLGDGYMVESSVGHIRDLPRNAADVPAAYKGESWSRLGVDTENDFKPLYVVTDRAKDQVKHLKALLKDADELYLATDEDREGEAIAWHLLEVLNPRVPVKRMVFHEITRKAIDEAINSPREVDRRLVDAQEARRILDRLYGYEVSPVLWKKVMPKLSAGRVQSVAVRIIVERERERMAFVSADYWGMEGTFSGGGSGSFGASLIEVDGARIATGKDFDEQGQLTREKAVVLTEATATALADGLEGAELAVSSLDTKPYRRRPAAPFMTSTLQQEAGRKLGFSSSRTMRAAQELYENGMEVITVSTRRNVPEAINPRLKTLNYLNNVLAKIEALDAGCEEGIMLNEQGYVAECTGDNIFLVKNGRVLTPPVSSGSLNGITRTVVMGIIEEMGYPMDEPMLTRYDVYTADECFLTGTAAEVIPVVSCDGRRIGGGIPGPVTLECIERFRALAETRGTPIYN
ncbi:MAG: DNA topoisomerase [Acidimicrobiales bacterium]